MIFNLIVVLSLISFVYSWSPTVISSNKNNQKKQTWMINKNEKTSKERADLLINEMTLDEKIVMLHGFYDPAYVGSIAGNERLSIPEIKMNDGPQGYRSNNYPQTTTAFPAASTIGSTWDINLAEKWGSAQGKEFYDKGANVQLGPGLNLHRVPTGGRNFEYLSGGDPYLGYTMVQPVVKGIQSQGIIANAKHWVENNQETNRDKVSSNVDERTRHEFYYAPFQGAVDAGVGSFMCGYNKVHDLWCCENPELLNTDLKGHLGFEGWVMSDWGATHSTSINEGLDQEMPGSDYFGDALSLMVQNGQVTIDKINDSVKRILTPMFEMGIFDNVNPNNDEAKDVTSQEHTSLIRDISAASHILLKNDNNALPLNLNEPIKIALIGNAARVPILGGGGSGSVFPKNPISPYQGFLNALNLVDSNSIKFTCNSTNVMQDVGFNQWGCESQSATSFDDCCEKCGKYASCNFFTYEPGWCGFYPTDDHKMIKSGKISSQCTKVTPEPTWLCNSNKVCVATIDGNDIDAATKLARESDVSIVLLAQFSKEGSDRDDLSFDASGSQTCQLAQKGQNNLVNVIAATGIKTIVAGVTPGQILTPWRNEVEAILLSFMPGEEYGNALADVVFGIVNPSAKLTITLPNIENEIGFTKKQFPGIKYESDYTEKMLIDYRWYTSNNVKPAYPFGHGLSYTTFDYSSLVINNREITLNINNNGKVLGSEVVQMYLGFPMEANTPPLQLKGFVKTNALKPGESQQVVFNIKDRDLSVWDVSIHNWKLIKGTFTIMIGSSSEDSRLHGELIVN